MGLARATCIVGLGVVFAGATATSAQAQNERTIVLSPAAARDVKPRYLRRARRSMRQAVAALGAVSMKAIKRAGAARCAVSRTCVAKVGARAKVKFAVGALLRKTRRGFELTLLLVDTRSARQVLKRVYSIPSTSALRRDPGSRLKRFLAQASVPSARAPPRSTSAPPPKRTSVVDVDVAKILLLPVAVGPRMPKRYVRRIRRSLASATKNIKGLITSTDRSIPSGCAADSACIAKQGRAAKVGRAVGVSADKYGGGFTLTFIVMDVATGRQRSRARYHAKDSGALATEPGRRLTEVLSPGGAGVAKGTWAPLRVAAIGAVRGDGRTTVPIAVSGGPPPRRGELARLPERLRVTCDKATALPAVGRGPPAILAPFVSKREQLVCIASRGGAATKFRLTLTPPGPGLYATTPPQAYANGPAIKTRVVVVGKGPRRPSGAVPKQLRVAVSSGSANLGANGTVTIELPTGKAPRTLVVALADGKLGGALFVPLVGRTKLKVQTERGSNVSVRVAGVWSGTFAAPRGRVRIAIEVPPGVQNAVVRAVDRGGFATESLAPLKIPAFRRLAAVAASAKLLRGGKTQIIVAVVRANGRPAGTATKLAVAVKRGAVTQPKPLGGGVWALTYTASRETGPDQVTIRVDGDSAAGTAVVKTTIVTNAPATTPKPTVTRSAPPSTTSNAVKNIHIGVHAGVVFPQLQSELKTAPGFEVEAGYRVWKSLSSYFSVGYTQPKKDSALDDPRLTNPDYMTDTTQRELTLTLGAFWRFLPAGKKLNVYAGVGARVWLLETITNGSSGGAMFLENRETSTRYGAAISGGVEYAIGPGVVVFELDLGGSALPHLITGRVKTTAFSSSLGYRLLL